MNATIDGTLFRLERMLARQYRLNVRTVRRESCAYFYLGWHWRLELDEHQIHRLADYLDSEASFRDELDKLLDGAMTLTEVQQEAR